MWSFFLPTPRPSRISMVIARETTSREARSLAEGANLHERSPSALTIAAFAAAPSVTRQPEP
jgi:hypothetical protein